MIELSKIRRDGGTQARAEIQEQTVADYVEAMENPETVFPPITVYHDGKEYWLADGFHRVAAWERIGRSEVPATIKQGDRRRAILHSVAANSCHGLRRSNADKRRAVMTLLEDGEWSQWSDRQIARQCGVSAPLVAAVREEVTVNNYSEDPRTYTTRHGTEAQMDTSRIGKAQPAENLESGEPEQLAAPDRQGADPEKASEPAKPQPEEPTSQPGPEQAPDPYGYAKLTDDALLETANGLHADLSDAEAKVKALKAERDDLKAENQRILDGANLGPEVSNLKRQIATLKGVRDNEKAKSARLQRQVNAQKAEIEKLKGQLGEQWVTI